jgi:glycerol-3-phosphate acyltransferase PlsX
MDEEPVRAVRAKPAASIVVATRLVRDGKAAAVVSAGSTGATMAAAIVSLGRLPGISRPPLAAVIPSPNGPVVLLDVGANPAATPDLLVQFAQLGVAYARVRLGLPVPRVGLLNVGTEPGKGDRLRRSAGIRLEQALRDRQASYVGNVEGHAVPLGGVADVVVTDGLTGNILVKGIEGTVHAMGLNRTPEPFGSASQGGAILLGVDGVVVVGHGASTAPAIAACISHAADVAAHEVLPGVREARGR